MAVRRYHYEGRLLKNHIWRYGSHFGVEGMFGAFDSSVFRCGGERRPRDAVAIGRFAPVAAGLQIRRRFPAQYGSHDRLLPPEGLRGRKNVNAVPRLP
jgi:hypothetical protein